MSESLRTLGHKQGLLFILIFLILTNLVILFDIPVIRQVLGLILIAILPGLLILFLLRLDRLEIAEKILLTIGLSAAFIMFFGWVLSQVSLQLGHTRPLDTYTLVLSLSTVLAMLAIGAYARNRVAFSTFPFQLELNTKGKLCLLLPSVFFLLSILGTQYLNISNNNIILITLLFLIPVSIIIIVLFSSKISSDIYPVAIIMIGAALLAIFWLRWEHIAGHDVHIEYYIFHMTLVNSHWSALEGSMGTIALSNLDSCLSISVLPAVFQSLLHINGEEYLFKGVYVLICTFMPLGIYVLSKNYIKELYAFLAAFFFASQTTFLIAPGSPRTNLATLFFTLCIIVLFHNEITGVKRKGLLIIFIAATVVSHYTTSYILIFLLLCTFLLGFIFRKYCMSRAITATNIAFFAVLSFLWYGRLTHTPFESGVNFIMELVREFSRFFYERGRDIEVSRLMGPGMTGASVFEWIAWVLTWIIIVLIAVGIIGTLMRRKGMVLAPQYGDPSPGFLRRKLDTEYFLLAVMGTLMLVATVVLPYISRAYGVERLYFQIIIILSVFIIIGAIILSKYIKVNPQLFILLIIIPNFLFLTGAVQEVFGYHVKGTLSSETTTSSYELVYEQESQASLWLKKHMDENYTIYTTTYGKRKLVSQGKIEPKLIDSLALIYHEELDGYVYIGHNAVVNRSLVFRDEFYDISEYSDVFLGKNKLYSNGGSEIYK